MSESSHIPLSDLVPVLECSPSFNTSDAPICYRQYTDDTTTPSPFIKSPIHPTDSIHSTARFQGLSYTSLALARFYPGENEFNIHSISIFDRSPGFKNPIYSTPSYILRKKKEYNYDSDLSDSTQHSFLDCFLELRHKSRYERIDEKIDKYPLLDFRLAVIRILYAIQELFQLVIKTSLFESFIILTIIANTIVLAIEDPTEDSSSDLSILEDVFLYIYTAECVMKIIGLGAFSHENAYFRQYWNLLDFFIVLVSLMSKISSMDLNLVALRAFRILRPLKSISTIPGLRILFLTLMYSFKLLMTSIALLVFFFMIFAIAGLQLWMGILKNRCIDLQTGEFMDEYYTCGAFECDVGQECVRGLDNPEYGMVNFDNIFIAFLMIFQCVTLEGWTNVMMYVQKAFSFWVFLYFIPMVFIGAYFLLNLTLAVIKFSYTEMDKKLQESRINPEPTQATIDLSHLKLDKDDSMKLIFEPDEAESYEDSGESNYDKVERQGVKDFNSASDSSDNFSKIAPEVQNLSDEREISREYVRSSISSSRRKPDIIDANQTFYELVNSRPNMSESFSDKDNIEQHSSPRFANSLYHEKSHSSFGSHKSSLSSLSRIEDDLNESHNNGDIVLKRKETIIKATHHTRNILLDIHAKIKIHKDLQAGIKKKIDLTKVKLGVSEDFDMTYSSRDYVIPTPNHAEERVSIYTFSYMHPADSTIKSDNLIQFNHYVKRRSFQDSFETLLGSCCKEVKDIRFQDRKNKRVIGSWSGNDVNSSYNNEILASSLSYVNPRLWSPGCKGFIEKCRYPIRVFVESNVFSNLMLVFVLLNTAVLSCYYYGISQEMQDVLDRFNFAFTIIFMIEMSMKLFGLGFRGYFKDPVNYLDFLVVTLSMFELFSLGDSFSSMKAFRTIRIFRIFRVLKVARLFRHLESMNQIIKVLSNISRFAYLALLLFLFIMIFALLGMQIFGGKFDFEDGKPRSTFDNFHWAFVTVFQILSLENWPVVMYDAMRSSVGEGSAVYFIIWIFLGNFILLNLFLAILLDNFSISGDKENEELIKQLDASLDRELESEKDRDRDKDTDIYSKKNSLANKPVDNKLQDLNATKLLIGRNEEIDMSIIDDFNDSMKVSKIEKPLYYGNECERSFFIFTRENKFRIFCYRLTNNTKFEIAILIGIIFTTAKLVWDTYIQNAAIDSTEAKLSLYLDILITSFFTFELLLKSISLGLVLDKGTYLRETWNKLDCFIVVFSIIELTLTDFNLSAIKVFRVLRILRPLKLIKHNLSMKLVVSSLLESIVALINVGVVLLIVWVMFAILGVSLFGGKFYSCENDLIDNRKECEEFGFKWENNDSNFDNLLEAMNTLFIITSLENWPSLMYLAIDATDQDKAPVLNNNPAAAYYFIVFILINSFFFLNLFNGVLFDKFMQVKQRESSIAVRLLTRNQLTWVEIQKFTYKSTPILSTKVAITNPIRLFLYNLCKSKWFKNFIMVIIVINIIQMAMIYDEAPMQYVSTLENLNITFSVIFCLEAVVKIIALTPKHYFSKAWNKFDFMVVCTSMIDIILSSFNLQQLRLLRIGPQLIRILRVLRVSRFIRIAKSMKNLQNQIFTLIYSLPAVLNVLSLLVLVLFIYAILGSFLFGNVTSGEVINEWFNFKNFGMSILTLIRIATGEDWNSFMYDCEKQQNKYITGIYFTTFNTVSSFVVLNLFIMVIIQEYDEFQNNPYSVPQMFRKESKTFQNAWKNFAMPLNKFKMHHRSLTEFMYELGDDLGMPRDTDPKKVTMLLATLDFELDNQGYVLYNELMYAILKRKYATRIIKAKDYELKETRIRKRIIKEAEISTKSKIASIKRKAKMQISSDDASISRQNIKQNIFVTTLYVRTVLKAWRNWVRKRKEQLRDTISVTPNFTFEVFPGDNSATSECSFCNSLSSYNEFDGPVKYTINL